MAKLKKSPVVADPAQAPDANGQMLTVGCQATVAANYQKVFSDLVGRIGTVKRLRDNGEQNPMVEMVFPESFSKTAQDTIMMCHELALCATPEQAADTEATNLEVPFVLPPAPVQHALQYVLLADIDLVSNVRSEYDEAEMLELTESIRANGVMQSIMLRPHPTKPGRYQLAAGHRRYLASQRAELLDIPASIREMTDTEFLEIQILENLQRSQVHPADEAVGFARLREHLTDAEIGARVGKPAAFVAQRAKLATLLPYWMQVLRIGTLPLVAANVLARQSHEVQEKLSQAEKSHLGYHGYQKSPQYSASEIQSYINRHIMRQLDSAPWKKSDAELLPKAGPCTTCPKRTSANSLLFPEFDSSDCCLDPKCWDLKLAAFVDRKKQELAAKHGKAPVLVSRDYSTKQKGVIPYSGWNEVKPGAKNAVQVLVVEGNDAGQVKTVEFTGTAAKALISPQEAARQKRERQAENRKLRIEAQEKILQAHSMYEFFVTNNLPNSQIEDFIRGQIIRYGGPHRDMRANLVKLFRFSEPEGGTFKMEDKVISAWVNENIQRLAYPQKLALYFAMLSYVEKSWKLPELAKQCGADLKKLKTRAASIVDKQPDSAELEMTLQHQFAGEGVAGE